MVVVGVRKYMPSDGAQFSKRAPRHPRHQKPQDSNVWRQILQKRGKQKTLRNEHNSGKKRDNFELRTEIVPWEPRPKHSGVAEPLPRPQLVIHPWRIYPSYGHWDDHFDDGYIRHVALNGLKSIVFVESSLLSGSILIKFSLQQRVKRENLISNVFLFFLSLSCQQKRQGVGEPRGS